MIIKIKKNKKILIVIPARPKSTRLNNKLTRSIYGIPMIVRVARNAMSTNIGEVLVATDSLTIKKLCNNFNINSVMTSTKHKSGTDRIFEAYEKKSKSFELIVNLQGDLPLFRKELISETIMLFDDHETEIGSAVCDLDKNEINDLNIVKAKVLLKNKKSGFATDFKRKIYTQKNFYHHIGIYVYKPEILKKFVKFSQTKKEKERKLEQMRALENNIKIKVVKLEYNPPSVDTKEDLKKIRLLFKDKKKIII